VFIISMDFSISVPIFHVPKQILLSWTNFFTHACSQRCENSWVFFTASRWRCNNPWSLIWHCTRAIQCVTFNRWPSIHIIFYLIHVIESQLTLVVDYLTQPSPFTWALDWLWSKACRKLPFMNFSFLLLHIYLTSIPIW
jgi:hypothetical protein